MRLLRALTGAGVAAACTISVLAQGQQQPASQPQQQPAAGAQSTPAPTQTAPEQPGGGQPVFRATAEAISLSVTVTDKRGKTVTDLTQDDFGVFEDGKPQPIVNFRTVKGSVSEEPIGVGLVLDVSLSMIAADKLSAIVTASRTFMGKLKKTDEVFLVSFASGTVLEAPWTTNRDTVLSAIRRLKTREGTNIYDAMVASLPIIDLGKAKKKVLLVLTDGAPRGAIGGESSKITRTEAAKVLGGSDAIVYVLVVSDDDKVGGRGPSAETRQAHSELDQVAAATGGRAVLVEGFAELENEINKLGVEVSQQYFLEFNRAAEKDGKQHQIVVGVKRKDVLIRHRRTYVAD